MAQISFSAADLEAEAFASEDGRVTRVYEFEGSVMYEVAVPAVPTRADRYVSDWSESALELSKCVNPRSSDKLPRASLANLCVLHYNLPLTSTPAK
jgi:hypothetical protein